jgi:cytochrome c-type biogenesis protein CcmE
VTVTAPPPAPPPPVRKPRRARYWVAGGLCLVAVAYLIIGGLGSNIVYFKTVSEAVRDRPSQGDHRFRLMGAVVTGSVTRTADGVSFQVTDGAQRASVVHHGDPPELFKDGIPVVCEGHWQGATFDSDRIMIKHGAEYHPPSVDASK